MSRGKYNEFIQQTVHLYNTVRSVFYKPGFVIRLTSKITQSNDSTFRLVNYFLCDKSRL